MANNEYMEMIELPVSTCEMIVVPKKKRSVKRNVVKKVNKKIAEHVDALPEDIEKSSEAEDASNFVLVEKKEKKRGFDIVAAQVAAVFMLVVAIILTNVFWENSGINTLIKTVFSSETQTLDERTHDVFSAALPSSGEIALEEGIMTIGSDGAIYSPVEGVVAEVIDSDGKYTVTISHSDKFKTVISGLDHAYVSAGEKALKGIPVGYGVKDECKVAMFEDDKIITAYALEGGSIVWEK